MAVEEQVEERVEAEPSQGEKRVEHATAQRMFRWSEFLHVGIGAEECSLARALDSTEPQPFTAACSDPAEHFHAWCRLPNQFQHRDIREKAQAAKARRIRQVKDPACDAHDVLEGELDILLGGPKDPLVQEILSREFAEDYPNAINEVDDEDRFEHIVRDRERFLELHNLGPEDRDGDEFAELERHIQTYADAVNEKLAELQKPRREALEGLDLTELVGLLRTARIDEDAQDEFMHTYNTWEWFAGTYKVHPVGIDHRPSERYFDTIDAMKASAPEVIEALQRTFTDLERAMQRGSLGNS